VTLVHTSMFLSETTSRKGRIELPKRTVVSGMGTDFPLANSHCTFSFTKYWFRESDPCWYTDTPEQRDQGAWPMQVETLCSLSLWPWKSYSVDFEPLKNSGLIFLIMKLKREKWYQQISTFRNKKQFWLTVPYHKCVLSKLLKDSFDLRNTLP